jgi:hypothetical protein
MTLAQMAEKPITVATEKAISSFADNRHGRSAPFVLRPDRMRALPISLHAPETLPWA